MKFTQRSIRRRKQLQRQKQLVEILGGKVAATHSTEEVPMRHSHKAVMAEPVATLTAKEQARQAYQRRRGARP